MINVVMKVEGDLTILKADQIVRQASHTRLRVESGGKSYYVTFETSRELTEAFSDITKAIDAGARIINLERLRLTRVA
jgi:hypothetical protein